MRRRDGWISSGGEITPRGQTDGGCNEAQVYKRVSAAVSSRYAASHGEDGGGGGGSSKTAAGAALAVYTWQVNCGQLRRPVRRAEVYTA